MSSYDPDRKSDLRTQAPKMVAEQSGKIVAQQKRGFARATNPRNSARRFGRNMPEEAWFPSQPPHAPRFAENRPEDTRFPSPPPRRWHWAMFMFAPPEFQPDPVPNTCRIGRSSGLRQREACTAIPITFRVSMNIPRCPGGN